MNRPRNLLNSKGFFTTFERYAGEQIKKKRFMLRIATHFELIIWEPLGFGQSIRSMLTTPRADSAAAKRVYRIQFACQSKMKQIKTAIKLRLSIWIFFYWNAQRAIVPTGRAYCEWNAFKGCGESPFIHVHPRSLAAGTKGELNFPVFGNWITAHAKCAVRSTKSTENAESRQIQLLTIHRKSESRGRNWCSDVEKIQQQQQHKRAELAACVCVKNDIFIVEMMTL